MCCTCRPAYVFSMSPANISRRTCSEIVLKLPLTASAMSKRAMLGLLAMRNKISILRWFETPLKCRSNFFGPFFLFFPIVPTYSHILENMRGSVWRRVDSETDSFESSSTEWGVAVIDRRGIGMPPLQSMISVLKT